MLTSSTLIKNSYKPQERGTITIKTEVESIFEENFHDYMEALVLASKNGIPLATKMEKQEKNESFSALSATILGASDVIFASFDKSEPQIVEVSSDEDILLIKGVGKNAVLSLLGETSEKNKLMKDLSKIAMSIEESKEFKR